MQAGDRAPGIVPTVLALGVVLLVTIWAGLRPFSWSRENDLRWVEAEEGLRFGPASMAFTEGDLRWETRPGPARLGWELWLRAAGPTLQAEAIVVLVDDVRMPALILSQSGVDIVVAARVTNADGERWYNDFVFPQVFADEGRHHLLLTSGTPRPRLFVDGQEILASTGFGIPLAPQGIALQGRILLGCLPRAQGSWQGELYGLLFHARVPERPVTEPAGMSVAETVAEEARRPEVLCAYAFREGRGDVVEDLTGRGPALRLPRYARPVGADVLAFTAPTSWTDAHVLLDMAVNLFGFLPFGFLLARLLLPRTRMRPLFVLLLAAATGSALSLGIEATQVLMPTRDSSLVDFLLNTCGTSLGAGLALYRNSRPETGTLSLSR